MKTKLKINSIFIRVSGKGDSACWLASDNIEFIYGLGKDKTGIDTVKGNKYIIDKPVSDVIKTLTED